MYVIDKNFKPLTYIPKNQFERSVSTEYDYKLWIILLTNKLWKFAVQQ